MSTPAIPPSAPPTASQLVPTLPADATKFLNGVGAFSVPSGGSATLVSPQGRLSLISGIAVQNADVAAGTTLCYVPFIGALVPVYSGSAWSALSVGAQISCAMAAANVVSGNVYDVFIINNAGTPVLATGPAWTNLTTRSAAITNTVGGLWTNSAGITVYNNTTAYTPAANTATYVGSIYASSNNTVKSVFSPANAAGGPAGIVGIYNAYNKVQGRYKGADSSAQYTYTTAAWRAANNSTGNSFRYLDGLADIVVSSKYMQSLTSLAATGATMQIGVERGWASGSPSGVLGSWYDNAAGITGAVTSASNCWYPALGLSTLQACEIGTTNANFTCNGTVGGTQGLQVDLQF